MPRILNFARYVAEDELSYNLSRPYNLGRWFKLQVVLVSVIVFCFLTVFSLATNGFDKQLKYTTDPNSTEAETHWYNNRFFTWGDDSLDPKCQNTEIPVGHEFMTTNLGLRYSVQRILYFEPGSQNGQEKSSISYHNNTLKECEIKSITLDLKKADMAEPDIPYRWWGWIDSTAHAVARCDITTDTGFHTLEFLVEYKTTDTDYSYIAVNNATDHASFWWGVRLLNAYFVGTKYFMSFPTFQKPLMFTRAGITYTGVKNATSMKGFGLFEPTFFFLYNNGGVGDNGNAKPDNGQFYNNRDFKQSRALTEGFFFAKVFRSLILVDLGNSIHPNLLLDKELLKYALDPGEDDFNRVPGAPLRNEDMVDSFKFNSIPEPDRFLRNETAVRFDKAFAELEGRTGELKTKNASIYAEYICNVPVRKSTSAMVLFTLVANLALFQTAWSLFKYVLDRKITWNNPTANWCEGCLENHQELKPMINEDSSANSFRNSRRSESMRRRSTRRLLSDEDGHS